MAVVLSCLILGQALGSTVAGALADAHGHQGAFVLATLGGLVSFAVTVLAMRARWYTRDEPPSPAVVTRSAPGV